MKYFLAHNNIDIFHYGSITEEQIITTGQPYLEYFEELKSLVERLEFFNVSYVENSNFISDFYDEDLNNLPFFE